jgi:hypothetical protein
VIGKRVSAQILAVDDVKLTLDKLVIHLRFSKTDQDGKGVSIEIPKITGSTIELFLRSLTTPEKTG